MIWKLFLSFPVPTSKHVTQLVFHNLLLIDSIESISSKHSLIVLFCNSEYNIIILRCSFRLKSLSIFLKYWFGLLFLGIKSISSNKGWLLDVWWPLQMSLLQAWGCSGQTWRLRAAEESAGGEYYWYVQAAGVEQVRHQRMYCGLIQNKHYGSKKSLDREALKDLRKAKQHLREFMHSRWVDVMWVCCDERKMFSGW